jgi:hypothetical protein
VSVEFVRRGRKCVGFAVGWNRVPVSNCRGCR